MSITEEDLRRAIAALEAIERDRGELSVLSEEDRRRLLTAAGRISRPLRAEQRKLNKAFRRKEKRERRRSDERILDESALRKGRKLPVFATPPPVALPPDTRPEEARTLSEPRKCYVCKGAFRQVHFFYDQMCPPCAELNYAKRLQTADLRGRTAMVTGARVKIGYQAAILLLRAGARVIVTTRFPNDAAARYAREVDFADWKDRLVIHGLDLRHTPSVEAFAQHLLATEERLDFILHNACQTVRRPPGFYAHLMEGEGREHQLAAHVDVFPLGLLDQDLQQVDLREVNSWRLELAEVPTIELLEVMLVNAVAPFVLSARLKPLMTRHPSRDKHIVNVSAMEGQFNRDFKTSRHPHTNMAKAALNMLTRTSAIDYVRDGIHINAVDTGWVTDEDPAAIAARKVEEHGFHPPLDIVDGAARICDPIFTGINTGHHAFGVFFKDYRPTEW